MTVAMARMISSLVLTATAVVAGEEACKYALQVLQLQDASSTFSDDMANMMTSMGDLMSELSERYPGAEYAISSFTDKPIPLSGYGPYGGYQTAFSMAYDYCYKQEASFTTDPAELTEALSKIVCGAGADIPEAQLEALLYAAADKTVGWNKQEYSSDGRPIVRIIVQVTDAYPHNEGDANNTIYWSWNYDRVYSNGFAGASSGGVGADDFCDHDGSNNWKTWCYDEVYPSVYPQWAQLFHKIDAGETLTDEETQAWIDGNATMGPAPMLNPITHPGGDWDPKRCNEVDYPSMTLVADTLIENNVFPVWLIAAPSPDQYLYNTCPTFGYNSDIPEELQMCVKVLYDNILAELGVSGYVGILSENSENLVETIMTAIAEIVNEVCLISTTTSTTTATTTVETTPTTVVETTPTTVVETTATTAVETTATTTVETTATTTVETTPATTVETTPTTVVETTPTTAVETTPATTEETIPVVPVGPTLPSFTTEEITTVESKTVETSPVPDSNLTTAAVTDDTTESTDETTAVPSAETTGSTATLTTSVNETTTEGGEPVPVPVPVPEVPADGGSSTAVIAGAAAGGAAAAAAVGFAAYKYIGAGMMKSSTAGTLAQVQQVDVPESPLEREAMEEVTMDMFQ